MSRLVRTLGLAVIILATLTGLVARASAEPAPGGAVTWLATGDSYSSGEGIPGTGIGTDTCAQSPKAFGPSAAEILRRERGWTIDPVVFSACTGAETGNFYNGSMQGHGSLWDWSQAMSTTNQTFDVITMSFGGNDLGFADVLQSCILTVQRWHDLVGPPKDRYCPVTETDLMQRVDRLIDGHPSVTGAHEFGQNDQHESLAEFYAGLAEHRLTARGVLVVVGYPRLFAPSARWARWRGERCSMFPAADADMLGRVAERLDTRLRAAVEDAQTRTSRQIIYVSRLDLFDAKPEHTLCGGNTEWLNGVSLGFWDGSGRWMHSFHPNELGHQATAEAVAGTLDGRLGTEDTTTTAPVASTVPTTAPPIRAPGAHFDIGDSFDTDCVVAWPTAPVRTSEEIAMQMSCAGVPQQYLLTEVIYADPELPITPSTGRVRVRGRIVDIATSELGFRELVVQADDIAIRG